MSSDKSVSLDPAVDRALEPGALANERDPEAVEWADAELIGMGDDLPSLDVELDLAGDDDLDDDGDLDVEGLDEGFDEGLDQAAAPPQPTLTRAEPVAAATPAPTVRPAAAAAAPGPRASSEQAVAGCAAMAHVDSITPAPLQPAGQSPPERVHYAAPITVRAEGGAQPYDGTIVNLSVSGLACLVPTELAAGGRVWTSFRLGLAERPLRLLCEVIRKRISGDGAWLYGVRFTSLTRSEREQLAGAVAERDGRVEGWTAAPPAAVEAAVDLESRSPRSSWMSAAAGMAAGIGLTLALAALPLPHDGDARAATGAVPGAVTASDDAEPPFPPTGTSAVMHDAVRIRVAEDGPGLDQAPTEPDEATLMAVAAAQANPTERAPAAPAEPEAAPAPRPAPGAAAPSVAAPRATAPVGLGDAAEDDAEVEAPRRAGAEDGSTLQPLSGADGALRLALRTDGPVQQHVTFWLSGPRRLVIDVMGVRSGFSRLGYDIDHPLAKRLRIGNHPGKVRFVLETSPDVSGEVRTTPRGNSLTIELEREAR